MAGEKKVMSLFGPKKYKEDAGYHPFCDDSCDLCDNLDSVTRVEVIDARGRSYVNLKASDVELSMQDDNRTLKIFIKENESDM